MGNVVIWSAEDIADCVIVPRPPRDEGRLFTGVIEKGEEKSFDPALHVQPLMDFIVSVGDVALIIIDPIVSAITGDSHKASEVRRGLQPLIDLAGEIGAALLSITHFVKGSADRFGGSVAFVGSSRMGMVAFREEPEDGSRRSKSNALGRQQYFIMLIRTPQAGCGAHCVARICNTNTDLSNRPPSHAYKRSCRFRKLCPHDSRSASRGGETAWPTILPG
jgi:AAA domain